MCIWGSMMHVKSLLKRTSFTYKCPVEFGFGGQNEVFLGDSVFHGPSLPCPFLDMALEPSSTPQALCTWCGPYAPLSMKMRNIAKLQNGISPTLLGVRAWNLNTMLSMVPSSHPQKLKINGCVFGGQWCMSNVSWNAVHLLISVRLSLGLAVKMKSFWGTPCFMVHHYPFPS